MHSSLSYCDIQFSHLLLWGEQVCKEKCSLSYQTIKFIHFEFTELHVTAELCSLIVSVSTIKHDLFFSHQRQTLSVLKFQWPCINMKKIPMYWEHDFKYNMFVKSVK